MRTLLLYNPVSGRNLRARTQQIAAIAGVLRDHGHEVRTDATKAPGSAAEQARTAVADGFELILACGGDGTLHDALQGLIFPGCAQPRGTLGVIPMGSANALARHLGLATDPLLAVRQILTFTPRVIPVGQLECSAPGRHFIQSRYFIAMAGAGPSGALVYSGARPLPGAKRRLGRLAYYAQAAALFATERFPAFELRWIDAASGAEHMTLAVGVMAVRIQSLGGLFHPLAPAARVDHPHLSLVVVRPPGWIGLPAWFAGSWLRQRHRTPLVVHAEASELTVTPAPNSRPVHLQADGEWAGTAPARVRLVGEALQLLVPAGF